MSLTEDMFEGIKFKNFYYTKENKIIVIFNGQPVDYDSLIY